MARKKSFHDRMINWLVGRKPMPIKKKKKKVKPAGEGKNPYTAIDRAKSRQKTQRHQLRELEELEKQDRY